MNIICLESQWYKKNPITVQPFLETLRLLDNVSYERFPCNNVDELRQHLAIEPHYSTGILYLCMHGRRGKIAFSENNKDQAPLESISEMMDGRYANWHIHMSNCSILNVSNKRYYEFKKQTGASIVSGYTLDVGWVESYATDMLLFSKAADYKKPSYLIKYMYNNYSELINKVGMYIE